MSLRSGDRPRLALPDPADLRRVVSPRPIGEWTLLGVFGVALASVVLSVVGGPAGVALAVAFVAAWAVLPTVTSYVLGHVLALGVSASALSVVELLFVEVGLIAVLAGPLTRAETRDRGAVARATLGFGFALAGLVVVGLALQDRVWPVAALLVLAGTGLAYGLHRYELLALGLVSDGSDPASATGDGTGASDGATTAAGEDGVAGTDAGTDTGTDGGGAST